jgi:hypothetical protein
MRPGETVIVRDNKGLQLTRIVVQIIETTVVICKEEEWIRAKKEGRDPICVGFPLSAVIRVK